MSLFLTENKKNTLLIDVDVNAHTHNLLGISLPSKKKLNFEDNPKIIRTWLKGKNNKINIDEFIKTTPPGNGSNFVILDKNNFILKNYSSVFNKTGHLICSGSYKEDAIGISCIHGSQSLAENILTHTLLKKDEFIVIDCSAGADFFGTTLFNQDVIIFVLKPEKESLIVYKQIIKLAKKAGIEKKLFVVINNLKTSKQKNILSNQKIKNILGTINFNSKIENARMDDKKIDFRMLKKKEKEIFKKIEELAQKNKTSNKDRLKMSYVLHQRLSTKPSYEKTYRKGLMDQVDPNFTYPEI
jgi:CO dehydrogenase maturation factor